MIRRPPSSTRTATPFPYTTLFRSYQVAPEDEALLADILDMARVRLPREFEQLAFSAGIEDWIRAVFACNQYVDAQAPWALRKSDPDRMRGRSEERRVGQEWVSTCRSRG